jgi:hypothetical protein
VLQLSRRDIEQGIRHLQSTHAQYLGLKGQTEEAFGAVASQCLSGVAAFGYGVAEGCYGPIKVGPVNLDLAAALLVHGVAFFGYAGRHQAAAHSIAQGLADGYAGRLGLGVGTNLQLAKGRAPAAPQPQVKGLAPAAMVSGGQPAGPSTLTAAELAAYVEQAR